MRWLAHGNILSAAIEAIARHGHAVQTTAELLPGVEVIDLDDLLERAAREQLDVMTTDKLLAARPYETKSKFARAMVFLQLGGGEVEQDDAIDRLFARYKSPKPGMLYTVTGNRVKVRQLPGIK
ncbi:MAG TPA: hypothetical protein VF624_14620 [Tepidisphaeraceae bacterium]|jgi:hypothetical protein